MGWLLFQCPDAEARRWVDREYVLTPPHEWCDDVEDLEARGGTDGVLGIVCDLQDSAGRSTLPSVQQIRARRGALPIVLWCRQSDLSARGLGSLAGPRFDAVLFRRRGDFEARALAQLFPRETVPYEHWIQQALERRVPRDFRVLVGACLDPDGLASGIGELARRMHQPRRTLAHRLHQANLPSIAELRMWGRLLGAAWRLGHTRTAIERVAFEMGFATAGSFRAALRRRTAELPHDLRRPEGFRWILRCFEHALDRRQHGGGI